MIAHEQRERGQGGQNAHGGYGQKLTTGQLEAVSAHVGHDANDDDGKQVAEKEEIKTGEARIRCYIDGEVKEYSIRVTQIDKESDQVNKGMVIQVTDTELLEKTGGIIQGMSGSPIIQNGKLIGAVTHVFVQDSTKGYGIFIENMLKEEES